MNRGDVWWLERPAHERRPVCVITRDIAIPYLNRLLAIPATTVIRGSVTEVPLDEDDRMPKPCVLPLDNIWTVRKALLTERITTLSPARMHQVCAALRVATGC